MKNQILVLLVCLAFCLGACQTEPPEVFTDPTTVPTQIPTLPQEITVPVQTTVPIETTEPLVYIEHSVYTDVFPELDIESSQNIVKERKPDGEFPFSVNYIHFSERTSGTEPARGNIFWICTEEQEMQRGSHYKCYVLEDGQLTMLANRKFSKTFYVLGTQVPLELEYTIYRDQVILTYVPENPPMTAACVENVSRGVHECFVSFTVYESDAEGRIVSYSVHYDLVDLETGGMAGLLSGFNKSEIDTLFRSITASRNVTLTEDRNILLYDYDLGEYILLDTASKTVIKNYSFDEKEDKDEQEYANNWCTKIDGVDRTIQNQLALMMPYGWSSAGPSWCPSPDGKRWLTTTYDTSKGTFRVMIYDIDANRLYEIQRKNSNNFREYDIYWMSNAQIAIRSEDRKNYCIYTFAQD